MSDNRILVAHTDAEYLSKLMNHLQDNGFEVVGPAKTARMALGLAAHGPVARAIVGRELAGQRNGAALAEALATNWGVSSIVIDRPDPRTLRL